jgi:hypothetical protein
MNQPEALKFPALEKIDAEFAESGFSFCKRPVCLVIGIVKPANKQAKII